MIYFIQEAGNTGAPIKIGYTSKHPEMRARELQTGYPHKLFVVAVREGSEQDESQEHGRWDHLRLHGEWFTASPDLIAHIESLNPQYSIQQAAVLADQPIPAQRRVNAAKWKRFVTLMRLEPGLEKLHSLATRVRDDGGAAFCANHRWYGCAKRGACEKCHGGIKTTLCNLVGWDAQNPELQTEEAYEDAYEIIYGALPDCRNCGCM